MAHFDLAIASVWLQILILATFHQPGSLAATQSAEQQHREFISGCVAMNGVYRSSSCFVFESTTATWQDAHEICRAKEYLGQKGVLVHPQVQTNRDVVIELIENNKQDWYRKNMTTGLQLAWLNGLGRHRDGNGMDWYVINPSGNFLVEAKLDKKNAVKKIFPWAAKQPSNGVTETGAPRKFYTKKRVGVIGVETIRAGDSFNIRLSECKRLCDRVTMCYSFVYNPATHFCRLQHSTVASLRDNQILVNDGFDWYEPNDAKVKAGDVDPSQKPLKFDSQTCKEKLNGTYLDGSCFVYYNSIQLNYQGADAHCQSSYFGNQRGKLVLLNTQGKLEWIQKTMQSFPVEKGNIHDLAWIGLYSDNLDNWEHKDSDGKMLLFEHQSLMRNVNAQIMFWTGGQPTNGAERAGSIRGQRLKNKDFVHDIGDTYLLPFFCEYRNSERHYEKIDSNIIAMKTARAVSTGQGVSQLTKNFEQFGLSLIDCVQKCRKLETCETFAYNKERRICHINLIDNREVRKDRYITDEEANGFDWYAYSDYEQKYEVDSRGAKSFPDTCADANGLYYLGSCFLFEPIRMDWENGLSVCRSRLMNQYKGKLAFGFTKARQEKLREAQKLVKDRNAPVKDRLMNTGEKIEYAISAQHCQWQHIDSNGKQIVTETWNHAHSAALQAGFRSAGYLHPSCTKNQVVTQRFNVVDDNEWSYNQPPANHRPAMCEFRSTQDTFFERFDSGVIAYDEGVQEVIYGVKLTECAQRCHANEVCMSFAYSKTERKCLIQKITLNDDRKGRVIENAAFEWYEHSEYETELVDDPTTLAPESFSESCKRANGIAKDGSCYIAEDGYRTWSLMCLVRCMRYGIQDGRGKAANPINMRQQLNMRESVAHLGTTEKPDGDLMWTGMIYNGARKQYYYRDSNRKDWYIEKQHTPYERRNAQWYHHGDNIYPKFDASKWAVATRRTDNVAVTYSDFMHNWDHNKATPPACEIRATRKNMEYQVKRIGRIAFAEARIADVVPSTLSQCMDRCTEIEICASFVFSADQNRCVIQMTDYSRENRLDLAPGFVWYQPYFKGQPTLKPEADLTSTEKCTWYDERITSEYSDTAHNLLLSRHTPHKQCANITSDLHAANLDKGYAATRCAQWCRDYTLTNTPCKGGRYESASVDYDSKVETQLTKAAPVPDKRQHCKIQCSCLDKQKNVCAGFSVPATDVALEGNSMAAPKRAIDDCPAPSKSSQKDTSKDISKFLSWAKPMNVSIDEVTEYVDESGLLYGNTAARLAWNISDTDGLIGFLVSVESQRNGARQHIFVSATKRQVLFVDFDRGADYQFNVIPIPEYARLGNMQHPQNMYAPNKWGVAFDGKHSVQIFQANINMGWTWLKGQKAMTKDFFEFTEFRFFTRTSSKSWQQTKVNPIVKADDILSSPLNARKHVYAVTIDRSGNDYSRCLHGAVLAKIDQSNIPNAPEQTNQGGFKACVQNRPMELPKEVQDSKVKLKEHDRLMADVKASTVNKPFSCAEDNKETCALTMSAGAGGAKCVQLQQNLPALNIPVDLSVKAKKEDDNCSTKVFKVYARGKMAKTHSNFRTLPVKSETDCFNTCVYPGCQGVTYSDKLKDCILHESNLFRSREFDIIDNPDYNIYK